MNVLEMPNIDLDNELSKCNSIEDLVGKNGLMQQLFGGIIQQFLESDMEDHLGREKYIPFWVCRLLQFGQYHIKKD